eukprot:7721090-Pyramimonas_sp.AAC.1
MVNAEIEQLVGSALDDIPIDVDAAGDMEGIESESYPQLLNEDWPRSNVSRFPSSASSDTPCVSRVA